MHRVLVPAHQSRQRVGQLVGVPDLDAVSVEPDFHPLADQAAMHRVGAAVNVDQAPRIDPAPHLPATVQTRLRQSLQSRDLLGEAIPPCVVANRHDPVQEARVLFAAGEVPAATQQQRLIDSGLEVVVRRFGIAVLVRLPGVDPLSRQTVVIQQVAVTGLELPRRREVVHRRAETVAAVPTGHAPEFPQRLLHAVGECLEGLRDADAHRFPVRVGQDEVVDHVLERLPPDRDAQRVHVREIGGGEVGGLMHLAEDRELGRPIAGPPLPDPPLEGASVGIEELAGVLLAEPVEECLGQELGFGG